MLYIHIHVHTHIYNIYIYICGNIYIYIYIYIQIDIKMNKNITPVLLLDDIFDKLDDHRVGYILSLIEKNKLGQTFITDTNKKKIPDILNEIGIENQLYWIENGTASKI